MYISVCTVEKVEVSILVVRLTQSPFFCASSIEDESIFVRIFITTFTPGGFFGWSCSPISPHIYTIITKGEVTLSYFNEFTSIYYKKVLYNQQKLCFYSSKSNFVKWSENVLMKSPIAQFFSLVASMNSQSSPANHLTRISTLKSDSNLTTFLILGRSNHLFEIHMHEKQSSFKDRFCI